MKKIQLLLVLMALVLVIPSCKKKKGPTAEEARKILLAKTWVPDDAVSVWATRDGADVTAEFTGFRLSITQTLTYSCVNGNDPVWPNNGSFTFGGTADAPNINTLIRDDGTSISITNISGNTMTLTFDFTTAHAASPSGTYSLDGTYVMMLKVE